MGDCCNCNTSCCDPCCCNNSNGLFGSGIWVWVIIAIVVIWIFSGNNNCC